MISKKINQIKPKLRIRLYDERKKDNKFLMRNLG